MHLHEIFEKRISCVAVGDILNYLLPYNPRAGVIAGQRNNVDSALYACSAMQVSAQRALSCCCGMVCVGAWY